MFKIFPILLLGALTMLPAGSLHLSKGYIKAHTEVLGDSTIDPATSRVRASLRASGDPVTLRGSVSIRARDLRSDNKERDQHMYEAMAVKKYPTIRFTIDRVRKSAKGYLLTGTLSMHGRRHKISVPATIVRKGGQWELTSHFRIKMSDYGIQPPKLLFLSVRDAVDLSVYLRLRG